MEISCLAYTGWNAILPVMPLVYRITNLKNGKTYIGASRITATERLYRHIERAKSGTKTRLYDAIRKWGAASFDTVVIKEYDTFEEALKGEMEFIALEQPKYNMTKGGEGILGFRHSEASRNQMSKSRKGRAAAWVNGPNRAEVCEKIRASVRLRVYQPFTEEQKNRRRATVAANPLEKIGRRVMCVASGATYPSVAEAARATGIPKSTIGRGGPLRGKRIGFIFVGSDLTKARMPKALSEENKERRRTFMKTLGEKQRKKVLCITTGITYPSLKAAHLATGISIPSIINGGVHRSRVVEFRVLGEQSA